jgi:hypothetical protein
MKKTFPLLLLIALSSNSAAQNTDNMLNDSINGHTVVSSQVPSFSSKILSTAIGIKYIGFGASILGTTILINSDPNSTSNDEERYGRKLSRILAIGGGVFAGVGQIIQDIQTLRLGRDYSNSHAKSTDTNIASINLVKYTEITDDIFDGKIFHDRKHFSLFKIINSRDENTKDSVVLISYWHDGEKIEIWIDPKSEKLIWDKK